MRSLLALATLAAYANASPVPDNVLQKRATTLIPDTCFSSTETFESYFSYNYPWGDTHNGGAIMSSDYVTIIHDAYLQLEAVYTGASDYPYNSGTVYAKQHFTVEAGGGLDFQSNFVAPIAAGTWPAFWLTGVNSWPPEIDMAEWKGTGKVSFNTFNTSSEVAAYDYTYPAPNTAWHTILCEIRDENGSDVSVKFYLNGALITTQYGEGMVGEPFYLIIDLQMLGSSGSSGPTTDTYYDLQYLSVVSYNP